MATDVRERAIADSQLGGGATTWAPATWYIGMSTTIPNEDGTSFTEPIGGSYARVAVTNNATNWPAATTVSGVTTKKNAVAITFPNPTGLWGLIIYYGLFVVATGDVPQFVGALDTPITVQSGNTPVQFDINQLTTTWD